MESVYVLESQCVMGYAWQQLHLKTMLSQNGYWIYQWLAWLQIWSYIKVCLFNPFGAKFKYGDYDQFQMK
jgi:hypothetical protein